MKITKNVILVFLLWFTQSSYGQITFSHSIGAAGYFNSLAENGGIMYSPRINFIELDNDITISAGTHMGLGLVTNAQGDGSYTLDVPLVAEINFGHAAHKRSRSSFGGFIGAGYGISKTSYSNTNHGYITHTSSGSNDAKGLLINGGLRAIIKKISIGMRVSYLRNTNKGSEDVLSLGFFYILGKH